MKSIGGNEHLNGAAIAAGSLDDVADGRPGICRVFVSYVQVDESYRKRLDVHLVPLVRDGLIQLWSDRAIAVGTDWERTILRELRLADIILLLVTPNFVASSYCFERELPEALRRHDEEGALILPVHVKAVDLVHLPFGRFQGLPVERRPITAWRSADDAWLAVARGVRAAVAEIRRGSAGIPRQRADMQ